MSRRVLVTGGAGFIGSHLAAELLAHGYAVRVLDNLSPQVHGPARHAPSYLDPRVELMVGDVRDPEAVRRALHGMDAVYHLVAAVGVGQSMYRIAEYTAVNNVGTAVLLEALIEKRVGRLVVASSMSIYGEGLYRGPDGEAREAAERSVEALKAGEWEVRGPAGEPLAPAPTPETKAPCLASVYALSKYDQERMCLMIGRAYEIPTVALRFFNVYGPHQALSNPYTGVMAIFATRLLNGKPPVLYEDGLQQRDFVSVYDVARACRLAFEAPAGAGRRLQRGQRPQVHHSHRGAEDGALPGQGARAARSHRPVPRGRHPPLLRRYLACARSTRLPPAREPRGRARGPGPLAREAGGVRPRGASQRRTDGTRLDGVKFALVNPAWSFEGSIYFGCREPHLPLEYGYAKALLERAGHEAIVFDAHLDELAPDELTRRVRHFTPDFTVITTAPSYLFWRCPPPELGVPQRTLRRLGREAGKVVVVGPHASSTPRTALAKLDADAAVLGECEEVLPLLAGDWERVPSLCYRRGAEIRINGAPHAARVADLPALAWPAESLRRHRHHHHRFDAPPAGPGAEVEFSRGCPYHCTFCAKDNFRDDYRRRPLETVLAEIDALIAAGVTYVYFIDEIFLPHRPLLDALLARPLRWGMQTRIDLWPARMLELAGRAGCVSIEAGVESITEEGRALLDKRCRLSTGEIAERLIFARRHVPFVQANLLGMEQDDAEAVEAWRAAPVRAGSVGQPPGAPVPLPRLARICAPVGQPGRRGVGTRAGALPYRQRELQRHPGEPPSAAGAPGTRRLMPVRRVLMTADTVGGVWTYALELARALAGFGVETTLAVMGGRACPGPAR